ncbi:MAG: DUF1302 family protein [Gammaproteobacteria bacterium]
MKGENKAGAVAAILLGTAFASLWPSPGAARYQFGDLEVSGELFHYSELRWGDHGGPETISLAVAPGVFLGPGDLGTPTHGDKYETLNAMRTELLLEFVYKGWSNITPVLKLRPYYDAMFDINGKDSSVARDWETNLRGSMNDEYDPLVREAFVDINIDPVFVRAGRQIVTWGRSDGVTVLDVVTPRNFRNPLTFEQERFMIPQWMINTNLDLSDVDWIPGGISKDLQIIWNLDYQPSRFPGFSPREEGRHPWTLNVVDYANQVIRVSEGLFNEPETFFDDDKYDRGNTWDQSEIFVRWRGRTGSDLGPLSDMTYSFHYAYLFEDLPFYELQDRIDPGFAFDIAGPRAIGGGIDFDRHRYHLAGFSFDKALMFLPGQFEGAVLRAEVAHGFGNQYYEPDLHLVESNNLTTLVGLDQYLYIGPRSFIETPWFVSFQYWRDQIFRDAGPGRFTNFGTPACAAQPDCGRRGYIIGGATTMFDGLRDEDRNVVTLFMFNDFLPGKVLHVELFALRELGSDQRATWFRGLVGYNFNSNVSGRVGVNVIGGKSKSFFGQFRENDSVFFEFKYTF